MDGGRQGDSSGDTHALEHEIDVREKNDPTVIGSNSDDRKHVPILVQVLS
jgi:hypothetical protein